MYILIEYSDIYWKPSGGLWQYYGDEGTLNNDGDINDFPDNNSNNHNSIQFKFKEKIIGQTENDSTKDVKIMVSLKYLSNFWRTLEMPLINCEIGLMLNWFEKCFLVTDTVGNKVPTFTITDTKIYILVVTLSARQYRGT